MPATTTDTSGIAGGEQGLDEAQQYLANFRTRFQNAKARKPKRPRGHFKRVLDALRGNTELAIYMLEKQYFGHQSMVSLQQSFDDNAEKLGLNVEQYSVYEHIDKQRLLVDWEHPDVEAQFDAWVLAHTRVPAKVLSALGTELDKTLREKVTPEETPAAA
jgi:hypothetical protein